LQFKFAKFENFQSAFCLIKLKGKRKWNVVAPVSVAAVVTIVAVVIVSARQNAQVLTNSAPFALNIAAQTRTRNHPVKLIA